MSSIPSLICDALFLSFNFGYVFFCSLLMVCVVHAETLMTKGSLLRNQERKFLWCYCVQLRNRNAISHVLKLLGHFWVGEHFSCSHCTRRKDSYGAFVYNYVTEISHVLKLFGHFLVRRADVFSHLFRTSIPSFSESSVFYVTLTEEQAFVSNGCINRLRFVRVTTHCVFFSLQAESMEKVGIADTSICFERRQRTCKRQGWCEGGSGHWRWCGCRGDRNFNARRLHLVASLASMRHDEPISTSWFFV